MTTCFIILCHNFKLLRFYCSLLKTNSWRPTDAYPHSIFHKGETCEPGIFVILVGKVNDFLMDLLNLDLSVSFQKIRSKKCVWPSYYFSIFISLLSLSILLFSELCRSWYGPKSKCSRITQTDILSSSGLLKKTLVILLGKGKKETPHLYCAPERAIIAASSWKLLPSKV